MKQKDVKVGETYYTRVGEHIRAVKVLRANETPGYAAGRHTRFLVVRPNTTREMTRTAAALHTAEDLRARRETIRAAYAAANQDNPALPASPPGFPPEEV